MVNAIRCFFYTKCIGLGIFVLLPLLLIITVHKEFHKRETEAQNQKNLLDGINVEIARLKSSQANLTAPAQIWLEMVQRRNSIESSHCNNETVPACRNACLKFNQSNDTELQDILTILIPFRDRAPQLAQTLQELNNHLNAQDGRNKCIKFFVVEQLGQRDFNKGYLMNAGFLYIFDQMPMMECVMLHDSDLIPLNKDLIYKCFKYPMHYSVAVDKFQFKLPYAELVGGVFAISARDYVHCNGYSNLYRGWGAEDDDMYERLVSRNLTLVRPRLDLARYKMIVHKPSAQRDVSIRLRLLQNSAERLAYDGLNTIENSAKLVYFYDTSVEITPQSSLKLNHTMLDYPLYHLSVDI